MLLSGSQFPVLLPANKVQALKRLNEDIKNHYQITTKTQPLIILNNKLEVVSVSLHRGVL